MANTIVVPVICKPIVKGRQHVSMLSPLAGVTCQDTTPYASGWLYIGAGSCLQLTLNLANFVGTIAVNVETARVPGGPLRSLATPPCDDYVQVTATPGTGTGQTCDWTITGQALIPFAPIQ